MGLFPVIVNESQRASEMELDWEMIEGDGFWYDHHRSTCRQPDGCVCGYYEMLASKSGLWKVEYARFIGVNATACFQCFCDGIIATCDPGCTVNGKPCMGSEICRSCKGDGFSEKEVPVVPVPVPVPGRKVRARRRSDRKRAYNRKLRAFRFSHEEVVDLWDGAWWALAYTNGANKHLLKGDRLWKVWAQAHRAGQTAESEQVRSCRTQVQECGNAILADLDDDDEEERLHIHLMDIMLYLEICEDDDPWLARLNAAYERVSKELQDLR